MKHGEPYGVISSTLIRTDKNGTRYYNGTCKCDRCGGAGRSEMWAYTGYVCYKCGGNGRVADSWAIRTPEYEAKLEAKRLAKLEAKRAYEEAHAEELKRQDTAKACEKARLALATCNDKHHCTSCAGCAHKVYCNLLTSLMGDLEEGEKMAVLSEAQAKLLDFLRTIDRTEPVNVETLDGQPCEEGRWFTDSYGNRKRVIVKPNGEKVYTSATSQKGLAKYGVRYTRAFLIKSAKCGVFYNREETKMDSLAKEMGKRFRINMVCDEEIVEEAVRRGIL
jgi:hypothetical protein